jgi:hypothetical protein
VLHGDAGDVVAAGHRHETLQRFHHLIPVGWGGQGGGGEGPGGQGEHREEQSVL